MSSARRRRKGESDGSKGSGVIFEAVLYIDEMDMYERNDE